MPSLEYLYTWVLEFLESARRHAWEKSDNGFPPAMLKFVVWPGFGDFYRNFPSGPRAEMKFTKKKRSEF